jgi:hypothetical protein
MPLDYPLDPLCTDLSMVMAARLHIQEYMTEDSPEQ